jgi:hypothetical protein
MGHVEVVIFMVLAEAKNVMSAMTARPEGNGRGWILDVMKTLLHWLLGGLGYITFSCPVSTRNACEIGNW